MTERAVRQAISREVRRALSAARLSAAAAAAKMPSRPAAKLIYRWTNAEVTAPLDRLDEFATAINQPLALRIGPDTAKEPPEPEWVGRLEAKLDELYRRQDTIMATTSAIADEATLRLIEVLAPAELREAARLLNERLEALPRPGAEAPNGSGAGEGRAATAPPGHIPGSHHGRAAEQD